MGVPRTTHTWLKNLYNFLDGKSLSPTGLAITMFGSPTGQLGFYGVTGAKQPTGLGTTGSAALGGVTGTTFFDLRTNGGTGTQYYTLTDLVADLKLQGLLAK